MQERPEKSPTEEEDVKTEEINLWDVAASEREYGLKVGVCSVASELHPERNEDSVLIVGNAFGVFDGLGGHSAGNIASGIARSAIGNIFHASLEKSIPVEKREEEMRDALKSTNELIFRTAGEQPDYRGMATTASVVKLYDAGNGKRSAVIGHVGDSRVYVMRAGGNLECLTLDDLHVYEALQKGEARAIQKKLANVTDLAELSKQERFIFEKMHILGKVLGRESVEPAVQTVELGPGDKLILPPDGIHNNLTDKEIEEVVRIDAPAQHLAEKLVSLAKSASLEADNIRSKPDDMSVIVVEIMK